MGAHIVRILAQESWGPNNEELSFASSIAALPNIK